MILYLDASALVKIVIREPETATLRAYLRRRRDDHFVTSALSRAEVVRAMLPDTSGVVARARDVLANLDQVAVDRGVLDDAAVLAPTTQVRSLDAIHLASARLFGADLRAIVTYDNRMAAVAQQLLLPVAMPSPRERK